MSEHIAHIAVFEDTARLLEHAPDTPSAVRMVLERHYDAALSGTSSSGSGRPGIHRRVTMPLLDELRANADTLADDPALARKLAFLIGWVAHTGADTTLDVRDNYRAAGFTLDTGEETATTDEQRARGLSETEKQVYDDAFLFRTVYDGGRRSTRSPHEPLHPAVLESDMASHPGSAHVDVAAVEPLVGAFRQNGLIELQSLYGSEEAVEGEGLDAWLDNFFGRRQEYMEVFSNYVRAFREPDPEKLRYYIHEFGLYDATDPLIALARSLQTGGDIADVDLHRALAAAPEQSLYAQALARAYELAQTVGRHVAGLTEPAAMAAALGIAEAE